MKICSIIILWLAVSLVQAKHDVQQGVAPITLKQHSIDSGGGKTSSNTYELTSSIGQLDGNHQASSTGFQVSGGFLQTSGNDLIFKNGFD